jgi:hypothetical protein
MQFIAYMLLSRYLHLYYYSKSIKNTFLKKKKKKSLPTFCTYPHLAERVGIGETTNVLILALLKDLQSMSKQIPPNSGTLYIILIPSQLVVALNLKTVCFVKKLQIIIL